MLVKGKTRVQCSFSSLLIDRWCMVSKVHIQVLILGQAWNTAASLLTKESQQIQEIILKLLNQKLISSTSSCVNVASGVA